MTPFTSQKDSHLRLQRRNQACTWPKEVGDGDDSYGEKQFFFHNFFVSTAIDTLPITDMCVLARRMH